MQSGGFTRFEGVKYHDRITCVEGIHSRAERSILKASAGEAEQEEIVISYSSGRAVLSLESGKSRSSSKGSCSEISWAVHHEKYVSSLGLFGMGLYLL